MKRNGINKIVCQVTPNTTQIVTECDRLFLNLNGKLPFEFSCEFSPPLFFIPQSEAWNARKIRKYCKLVFVHFLFYYTTILPVWIKINLELNDIHLFFAAGSQIDDFQKFRRHLTCRQLYFVKISVPGSESGNPWISRIFPPYKK